MSVIFGGNHYTHCKGGPHALRVSLLIWLWTSYWLYHEEKGIVAKIITRNLKLQYNTFKFHLTGSRWSMTSSKLCSLRTCQRCSVSIDRSINDLKLIKKFFSATNASADAKEENKNWHNSQLTENHWWNINLSILGSSCYNRSKYFLVLAVS